MKILFTAILAVIPSLLLLWYFYKRDLNPEPRGVLIKTFFLGILITIPVNIKGKVSSWTGLWVAVLLHGLYDFPLFVLRGLKSQGTAHEGLALAMFVFFVAILVFEITWTLRIVRRLRREQVQTAPVLHRGTEG